MYGFKYFRENLLHTVDIRMPFHGKNEETNGCWSIQKYCKHWTNILRWTITCWQFSDNVDYLGLDSSQLRSFQFVLFWNKWWETTRFCSFLTEEHNIRDPRAWFKQKFDLSRGFFSLRSIHPCFFGIRVFTSVLLLTLCLN